MQGVDCKKSRPDYFEEIEYVFVINARASLESPITALTREEILIEQHSDEWCKQVRESVRIGSS